MKVRLKAALLSFSAILAISATSFSTLAYLTSEDVVNTVFTVGDVSMSLVESAAMRMRSDGTVAEDGTVKLVPNYEYRKDISVSIDEDSEVSWVFVRVKNGIADIEAADGTIMADGGEYRSVKSQTLDNGWIPLVDEDGTVIPDIYVYNTHAPYHAAEGICRDLPVFGYFKIDSAVNGGTAERAMLEGKYEDGRLYIGDYDGKTVEVTAYAVQAEGLESAIIAWNAAFKDTVAAESQTKATSDGELNINEPDKVSDGTEENVTSNEQNEADA